jgi:hypothetical protein
MIEIQEGLVILNLKLFLLIQIMFTMLIMAEVMTNLHWELHHLLVTYKTSIIEFILTLILIISPSQFQRQVIKVQFKNRCTKDSKSLQHKLHISSHFIILHY